MGRLFVSISLCCLVAWLICAAGLSTNCRIWLGGATFLAAIGLLFAKPFEAALNAGVVLSIVFFVGFLLFSMIVLANHHP
jgi:hypothetical protein